MLRDIRQKEQEYKKQEMERFGGFLKPVEGNPAPIVPMSANVVSKIEEESSDEDEMPDLEPEP